MAQEKQFSSAQMGKLRVLMMNFINKKVRQYNLSSIHAMYIAVFKKCGSLSQTDATRLLNFDKSHSSRVFRELEEKGIIHRANKEMQLTREFPESAAEKSGTKKITFMLTDYGGKVADEITGIYKEWQKVMFAGIDRADIEVYNKVQNKIVENCMLFLSDK